MLRETRAGLTEAVVIGPGRAILFYRRCSMGEGLKAEEARDAAFLLTGAGTWVGKLTYLTADPMTLQEGRRAIAQAVLDHRVKARGPGRPRVNLPAQQPFRFNTSRASPPGDQPAHEVPKDRQTPRRPFHCQGCNRRRRDQRLQSPRLPSPLPDRGFESNRSLISMASSISSQSDHSDGSRHSRRGRRHWEETRMKINLLIFKDEDAKDTVTYQSWRWDLTVYRHAGCRDHTLLPYAIRSLQGYPGELVHSSGTDITLYEVLTMLDEHYNNVKALDALNQELFQMRMADKETVSDWGVCLSQHLQILAASFPNRFPPECVAELKRDRFYGRLPKRLKAMVAYLKVGPQVRTYSDYLRAAREAEKEDSIELSQSPRATATDGSSKPSATSFFPLRKLKGSQLFTKKPAICLAQLEEEGTDDSNDPESGDPDGIEGVTEEFMVRLARAVKDAQTDKKCCYHCSSPKHFICNCPLMKAARGKKQLNRKEGMATVKGAQTPPKSADTAKSPQQEAQEA